VPSQLATEGISDLCCDTTIELEVVGANEIFSSASPARCRKASVAATRRKRQGKVRVRGRKLVQRIAWPTSAWAVKALAVERRLWRGLRSFRNAPPRAAFRPKRRFSLDVHLVIMRLSEWRSLSAKTPAADNNASHQRGVRFCRPRSKAACGQHVLGKCDLLGHCEQPARPRTIYMSRSLRFRAPVRARDTVRAIVTVTEVMVEKGRALLRIQCRVCECVVAEARLLLQSGGLKTL